MVYCRRNLEILTAMKILNYRFKTVKVTDFFRIKRSKCLNYYYGALFEIGHFRIKERL